MSWSDPSGRSAKIDHCAHRVADDAFHSGRDVADDRRVDEAVEDEDAQQHPRHFAAAALALTISACGACSISTQQEVQLGAQSAAEINRQLPIIQNPSIHNYINQLGRSIATRVDPRLTYTFYVVNTREANAFAVPGGHVYVYRGLVERTQNASELAGVLGHEVAHVAERHSIEQWRRVEGARSLDDGQHARAVPHGGR